VIARLRSVNEQRRPEEVERAVDQLQQISELIGR
jgi:hypothetical protein